MHYRQFCLTFTLHLNKRFLTRIQFSLGIRPKSIFYQVSPPLQHQQRPLEDKKMPTPNGGSPPAQPQNMKPRPDGSPSLAVLSNHHGVGGPTQAPTHGGGYPVYQNSGGHQPPLQVDAKCVWISSCISTQAAPMVSPRHFATAPAPPAPAMEQFGHCPKVMTFDISSTKLFSQAREGPALSCNFCWNTTDGSGRILRRKTKYHCPECQTNLCIGNGKILAHRIENNFCRHFYKIHKIITSSLPLPVPCFQQYHEAMENENSMIQQWWRSELSSYSTDMTLNRPLRGFIS